MAAGDPAMQGVGSTAPLVLTIFWNMPTPAPEELDSAHATTVTLGWHYDNDVVVELLERQIKVIGSHSNVHLVLQFVISTLEDLMTNLRPFTNY